jgi:hypothetical protein
LDQLLANADPRGSVARTGRGRWPLRPMGLHEFLQQNFAGVDADAHVSHLLPWQPVVSTSLETFPCRTHPTQADASLRTPYRPKLTTSDQIFGDDA